MVFVVFNICILLLPISFYLISISYHNNYKKLKNDKFLSLILIMQVVLFLIFKKYTNSLILINIPLLISYLKRKELTSFILSILIVFYYIYFFSYPVVFIIFEYIIYYVIYYYINHKSIKVVSLIMIFVFLKSIVLTIEIVYFNNSYTIIESFLSIVFRMLVFYLSSYLVFIYLLRGEEMMNLNTAIKELEKEKVLRTSLFKMTHEIKNPIAVCKGYLDMLDINNKDKVSKYIPIIKGEIERTLTLMDDYLDYTKVKINKEEVDIYLLLNEIMDSLELFFKENKINFQMEIPDDELYLRVDYNRIKQVLVNVLKNAHEARDNNKKEMIIKLRTRVNKRFFKIIVEDNGVGMDEDTLNQVTNLFFTTKKNGTGLGTSLSKEIIELHGGKIKYLSNFGVGTIVIISLPL